MTTRILVLNAKQRELLNAALTVHYDNLVDDMHDGDNDDAERVAERDEAARLINELDQANSTYEHPTRAIAEAYVSPGNAWVVDDEHAYDPEDVWLEGGDTPEADASHWRVMTKDAGPIGVVFDRNPVDGKGYLAIMGAGVICGAFERRVQAMNAVALAYYG